MGYRCIVYVLVYQLGFSVDGRLPVFPEFTRYSGFSMVVRGQVQLPFLFFRVSRQVVVVSFRP